MLQYTLLVEKGHQLWPSPGRGSHHVKRAKCVPSLNYARESFLKKIRKSGKYLEDGKQLKILTCLEKICLMRNPYQAERRRDSSKEKYEDCKSRLLSLHCHTKLFFKHPHRFRLTDHS